MRTYEKAQAERFRGPSKYVQYLLARCLIWVLQRLPVAAAYKIGRCIGWVCWKLLKCRRQIVRKNLKIVNAWLREDPSRIKDQEAFDMPLGDQVREVFQRSGASLFSGFTFSRMAPKRIGKHLQMDGVGYLEEALSENKGAIILLAHMGPWEALAQLPGFASNHGIKASFGAMYRPLNNVYLDNYYRSLREARGTTIFSRIQGFHKPVDFIRRGGMLGILSDQKMREGVDAPYFGQTCRTTPIPGLFHRRSGAPFLSVSIRTTGVASWSLSIHQGGGGWPEGDIKDRAVLARHANQILEHSLSRGILDGFWFHNRFS